MPPQIKPDLFTFVARAAVERGAPLPITCNCGGVITVLPPLQEEVVICARCESRIKLLVIEGDPGYVFGADPNGEPMLIPVQGSSKEKLDISPEERQKALDEARERFGKAKPRRKQQ